MTYEIYDLKNELTTAAKDIAIHSGLRWGQALTLIMAMIELSSEGATLGQMMDALCSASYGTQICADWEVEQSNQS